MALTMYDAVGIENIPADAENIGLYIDGPNNYAEGVAKFPHAKVLTITTSGNIADCCDSETGDLTPAQAVAWVERMLAAGRYRPCVYANASRWSTDLLAPLAHYGNKIRRFVASWDGVAEVPAGYDAKQYQRVGVYGYDESVVLDDFFDAAPKPAPPKPPTKPSGVVHFQGEYDIDTDRYSIVKTAGTAVYAGPEVTKEATIKIQIGERANGPRVDIDRDD